MTPGLRGCVSKSRRCALCATTIVQRNRKFKIRAGAWTGVGVVLGHIGFDEDEDDNKKQIVF